MNLYELTGNYLHVLELAQEGDFDEFADTLEMLNDDIELKAENYGKIIKSLSGDINTLDEEIKRLTARKSAINNNIDRLKENLFGSMKSLDKQKIKTPLFNISIAKNPASLIVDDDAEIPNNYYIAQAPKLDKAALKNDIKAGVEIKGCSLVQTESLRIK